MFQSRPHRRESDEIVGAIRARKLGVQTGPFRTDELDRLAGAVTRRSVAALAKAFYDLPFEPYYLVKRQEFNILRAVNRRRHAAGLPPVPKECIWLKRRPVKPFGTGKGDEGFMQPTGQDH